MLISHFKKDSEVIQLLKLYNLYSKDIKLLSFNDKFMKR